MGYLGENMEAELRRQQEERAAHKDEVQCAYCQRWTDDVEATSEVGNYCTDCHRLVIANCREAINKIIARRHSRQGRKKEASNA